ncbi:DNA helicase mcm9 [Coemansia brasiliensis]|uniref:DNA helicase n=1 Tax=Coemansia brasiliensis TaxID=2650707 RepID=A0A9W8IBT6_9FUNG|nr:DNA helicase mcm9 [Coemansia brasiliensis]
MTEQIANDAAAQTAMQLFLEEHCSSALEALLFNPSAEDDQDIQSLEIDMHELIEFNYELAMLLLESPSRYLPLFNHACVSAQRSLKQSILTNNIATVNQDAQVRITHLPNHPVLHRTRVPGSDDVGRLLCISGTVIRTGLVKMMETHRTYACTKCRGTFSIGAEIEQYNYIPKPVRCLAPGPEFCNSTSFTPMDSPEELQRCVDYQEIKIQEQVGRLTLGTIPRSIVVILERDLVDKAKSGDSVTITGVVMCRWRPVVAGERPDISVVIRANSIKVHSDQTANISITDELRDEFQTFWTEHTATPMQARDKIIAGMCPQVYGLFYVKLAVILVLISGVARSDDAGLRVRGEAHLLLVGDPGTAKSQFLKYAAKLMPRSVLTTGIGSTSAGLTVTAVKDGPEWQLEAGALVLADRGLCCIDEFGSIRESEKSTILEAMEQQSISVAKAGIVCKLNARCSVLAAMNPRGKYDIESSLTINTALSTPLLSRFDLILVLLDTHDEQWDARVSSFLLNGSRQAEAAASEEWEFDKLQAYIAYVKTTFQPSTTPASEQVLTRYYQMQRQRDLLNAARTTIRLLESLIRLAQAHARLMFRNKVVLADAVIAIVLMESTMLSASVLGVVDTLHTTFPEDSDLFYNELEELVLQRLGLEHLSGHVEN